MKRYLISLALAAGITATAASAVAAPPPVDNTFDTTFNDCAAEYDIPVVNAEVSGKFARIETGAGTFIETFPGAKITLTNPVNDKTVSYVITGSNHITSEQISTNPVVRRETIKATGRNLLTRTLAQKGIYITIGNFSFVRTVNEMEPDVEDDDVVTIEEEFKLNGPGRVIDVCAALA
jgi:hypothetical protein